MKKKILFSQSWQWEKAENIQVQTFLAFQKWNIQGFSEWYEGTLSLPRFLEGEGRKKTMYLSIMTYKQYDWQFISEIVLNLSLFSSAILSFWRNPPLQTTRQKRGLHQGRLYDCSYDNATACYAESHKGLHHGNNHKLQLKMNNSISANSTKARFVPPAWVE